MDQSCKVAKPAHGQLNREIKCPCRCIRGIYIYMYWYSSTAFCICLYTRYIVNLGAYIYVNARFTAVYCICIYICVTTAVCT